jgi:predicted lactoylglutathione lyase
MQQRMSLITLGVADVDAARAFYERMGWRPTLVLDDVTFFQAGGSILGLWGRDLLAEDSAVVDSGGWGGVTLAQNVGSREEVDAIIEEARSAGARIGREPVPTEWGGYSGVFVDPDGHPWEVAHNPGFELSEDGSVRIPPASG